MRYKHIVIEGPNNVGKSTLVSVIKRYGRYKDFDIEHLSNLTPNDYHFHQYLLSDVVMSTIYDRFCFGEVIYSTIYNRNPKLTYEQAIQIVKSFNDTLFVFVDADWEFITNAYNNKSEQFDFHFVSNEKKMFNDFYNDLKKCKNVVRVKNHLKGACEISDLLSELGIKYDEVNFDGLI